MTDYTTLPPLQVNVQHPESGLHPMTAIGADSGAATLINTAIGGIERIPLADFEQMVVAVYLPKQ